MPHAKGTHLHGIRTLDDLRQRCVIDTDTGCWHWRLALSQGAPRVHLAHPCLGPGRHVMRGRRAALLLARGRDLPAGHVAYARLCCASDDCVNPAHCQSGSRDAHGRWLHDSGRVKNLITKVRASRAAWAKRGRKITPELRERILASTESTYALARDIGVSQFAVWAVRKGHAHKPHLAQASVFTWRPAA